MIDSLFLSAAFIIVEIGLTVATFIGKFGLLFLPFHRKIGRTKYCVLLQQLLMNCGLVILFGQKMKKSSEQQHKVNVGELVTIQSTILRGERKKTEVDHRDVLRPQMTYMIEQQIQEGEVQGRALDGW